MSIQPEVIGSEFVSHPKFLIAARIDSSAPPSSFLWVKVRTKVSAPEAVCCPRLTFNEEFRYLASESVLHLDVALRGLRSYYAGLPSAVVWTDAASAQVHAIWLGKLETLGFSYAAYEALSAQTWLNRTFGRERPIYTIGGRFALRGGFGDDHL